MHAFKLATEDASLMPPRCCVPMAIHSALRHLSEAEADEYRTAFKAWVAGENFVCPVPACSAFIPVLSPAQQQQRNARDHAEASTLGPPTKATIDPQDSAPVSAKRKSDATPSGPATVTCPKCNVQICRACRELSHVGSICPASDTLAMLHRTGHKQCPSCGFVTMRMGGCVGAAGPGSVHWLTVICRLICYAAAGSIGASAADARCPNA